MQTVLKTHLTKNPNLADRAFYLNGDKENIYFLLEPPVRINSSLENGLYKMVIVLKLMVDNGRLMKLKLYLKKQDVTEMITNAKFYEALKEGLTKVKAQDLNNPIIRESLNHYLSTGI